MQNSEKLFKIIDLIFNPASIAVIGASENPASFGFHYIKYLHDSGFKGTIFPVNPKTDNISGYKSYASLDAIPSDVDYIICCIRAELVPDLLDKCPAKNVRAVHLLTGRLSETGDLEAIKLERLILKKAKEIGVRLIGPNCMGLYNPGCRISFNYDLPMEQGSIGGIFQSGGVAGEFVRFGGLRGLRFSKIISHGNAIDLDECDLLEYFYHDPDTKLIVMYIEGVKNGQRLIKTLSKITLKKPVIILKGGRGNAGAKAASSHTASIAGSFNIWDIVFKQCNVVKALSLEEVIDLSLIFSMPAINAKNTAVIGGGGGKGILAADECEEAGLVLPPLPEKVQKFVQEKDPFLTGWIGNPVDFSILGSSNISPIEMLDILSTADEIDLLMINITEDNPFGKDVWSLLVKSVAETYIKISEKYMKPLIIIMGNPPVNIEHLKNWRWQILFEQRDCLIKAGIPIFSSVNRAARCVMKKITYEKKNIMLKIRH